MPCKNLNALKFMRFVAVLAASCSLATAALAAPRWVRVSVPATDAATSEVVAWNSDGAEALNSVEYGTSANKLDKTATGSSFAAKGKLGVGHEVTLTGLLPDTQYWYRVGGAGDWSAVHHFRTAPTGCAPFKFIASGDHRSDDTSGPNPKWESILGEMAASGAAFILETGDLVHDGNDINQWWNHMEMGAKHMGELALMPSFGNHDSDDVQGAAAAFNQIFALPANKSTATEDFYAFTYGPAIFVALSTATYADAAGFAQQAKWLDETLTANADKVWKFVYFHHPILSSYINLTFIDLNHPPNEKGQAAAFVPIFDKHHVDVVFAGHNHFYERFAPSKGGKTVATPADGTIYITTGGAGAFTYDAIDVLGFKIEPMKVICGDGFLGFSGKASGSQACTGKHHYVEVSLDGNVLTAKVLATAAQNLSTSSSNQAVIETWSITKPPLAPSVCGTGSGGPDAGSGNPDAGSGSPDAGSASDIAVQADAGGSAGDAVVGSDVQPDGASSDASDAGGAVATDAAAPDSADIATPPDAANVDLAAADVPQPDAVPPASDAAVQAAADVAPGVADTAGGLGLPGADTSATAKPGAAAPASPSGCAAGASGGAGWWLPATMLVLLGVRRRRPLRG